MLSGDPIGYSTMGPVVLEDPTVEDDFEYIRGKVRVRKQIQGCRECPLGSKHGAPVPFSGPRQRPTVAVLGEAPGLTEDRKGEPFIGRSGKLLRKTLTDRGFEVDQVAFINAVCCLPTDEGRHHNRPRPPRKEETVACRRNLFDQLQAIRPSYVLLAGVTALHSFRPDLRINRHHGRLYVWQGKWLVLPTYHPASVARQNSEAKDAFYDDIELFRLIVKEEISAQQAVSGWCTVCGEAAEKFDPNLAGYCPEHWKGNEKKWHASSFEGQILHGKGTMQETEMFPGVPREPKTNKARGRIR